VARGPRVGFDDVIVVGGGIGGLTLALCLHRVGVPVWVFEAVPQVNQAGVGITLLPHATRVLAELNLLDQLTAHGVPMVDSVFYNRFGQFVHREPTGTSAGLAWPQIAIHRADLYDVLLAAVRERLGDDRITFDARFVRFDQDERAVHAHFQREANGNGPVTFTESGSALIGCDGIRSAVRKCLYPQEPPLIYQGFNMWRGVTPWEPFLSGASMLRVGWYASGKLTIYPCRDNVNAHGHQLMNWIAAIETDRNIERDWGRPGQLEDFIETFDDWTFDFLDVPAVLRSADAILEYPMVDQDPLPQWTFGRVTLLGDAAHPLLPRGSNGAGQAIVDCRALASAFAGTHGHVDALHRYEEERRPKTSQIVYRNRADPPDAILREVCLRTGDRRFDKLSDVITQSELDQLSEGYRHLTGYSQRALS
jgi:5-methylphenazine-1-carboxylate 1-monooxygenase